MLDYRVSSSYCSLCTRVNQDLLVSQEIGAPQESQERRDTQEREALMDHR